MKRIKRASRALAVAALLAGGLSGCSGFGGDKNAYTCPAAMTVQDIQTIVDLSGPNSSVVPAAGKITSVTAACDREKGGVRADVAIDMTAMRSTGGVRHVDFPYFIAIADSTGNILGKKLYSVGFDFDPGAATAAATQKITAHLPLANPQLANIYTIIVGFQLNQKELDFNRAHQQ